MKKLEPGITKIGEIVGEEKGLYINGVLYYGNLVLLNNGEKRCLYKDDYLKALNTFLSSTQGGFFERPSDEEIEKVCDEYHGLSPIEKEKRKFEIRKKLKEKRDEELIEAEQEVKEEERAKPISIHTLYIKEYKTHKLPLILMLVFMLATLVFALDFFGYIELVQEEPLAYSVITLKKDVKRGALLSLDDIEETLIPISEFEEIGSGSYVGEDGIARSEYGVLWANSNSIVGKYAVTNLKKGSYLKTSDYTNLENGVNQVEMVLEDGTSVLLPIKAENEESSKVRLYAIVTSTSSDGSVSNQAINMGELNFTGESLKSILSGEDVEKLNTEDSGEVEG